MVRFFSGKLNGTRATRSTRDFDEFIRDKGLKDIPLNNSIYKWSNLGESLVCSRLDILHFFSELGDSCGYVRQEALVRVVSSHCPIFWTSILSNGDLLPLGLRICGQSIGSLKKNFFDWWDPEEAQGREVFKLMKKLRGIKQKIKQWKEEVFGDIRLEKEQF